MRSFFEEIRDSNLTWTSDDNISISSSSSSDDESIVSSNSGNDPAGPIHVAEEVIVQNALGEHRERETEQEQLRIAVNQPEPLPEVDEGEQQEHDGGDAQPIQLQNDEEDLRGQQRREQNNQNAQIHHHNNFAPAVTQAQILHSLESNERCNELLFRIARSEVLPLIRAEIDWKLLQGQLSSYPSKEIRDENATFLLQSILRMDPPLELIQELFNLFPKSCVDMAPFYAACQYASDEAVQLLMRRTMKARKSEGINWSMLALLGDARIRLRHAKFLLRHTPEVVKDSSHGVFGVSPLDRMLSGAFIHGDAEEWVSKLKLALLTADRGFLDEDGQPFYPFHALLKRLISSDFGGVEFGALSFVNCLSACVEGENDHLPFHQTDEDGNLPIHVVFGQKCDTNLGIMGERKLAKFLLHVNGASAMMRNAEGILPIRLAIKNGWPVYDIIIYRCPRDYISGADYDTANADSLEGRKDLLIHDILSGPYDSRFGISGARELVKFVLEKCPDVAEAPNSRGQYPIHLAIANGWPCHDLIVAAAPSTLEVKDNDGHYPYQIAACSEFFQRRTGWTDSMKLSMLYELIREGPTLIDGMGRNGVSTKRQRRMSGETKMDQHAVQDILPSQKKQRK